MEEAGEQEALQEAELEHGPMPTVDGEQKAVR